MVEYAFTGLVNAVREEGNVMTEEQVRDWLAEKFEWSGVPDELWEMLDEDAIRYACRSSAERWDLYDQAKRRQRQSRAYAAWESAEEPTNMTATPERPLDSETVGTRVAGKIMGNNELQTGPDAEQTLAFSTIVAEQAARHPSVVDARDRIFGSRVLDAGQFLRFVMSPANRFLSSSDLESRGICPVEHDAQVVGASIHDGITDITRYSSHQELTILRPPLSSTGSQHVAIKVQHQDRIEQIERRTDDRAVTILYLAPDLNEAEKIVFGQITLWRGSVLDEVSSVAETLSINLPWREAEAFTFLLTGMFPVLNTVSSTVDYYPQSDNSHLYARINISAVPWASSATVLARFYAEREFLLRSKKRSFSAKNLTLTTFVTNRLILARLKNEVTPRWSTIRNEWNQRYPDWTYSEPNYLRNDYYRTRKRIQFYPSAFPETSEEELVRYDQLQSRIWFGPMFVNPAGDVS